VDAQGALTVAVMAVGGVERGDVSVMKSESVRNVFDTRADGGQVGGYTSQTGLTV